MFKRIFALLLCALMIIPCFAGCSKKHEDDLGAYITMYLTDEIYDFDPANAYYNTDTLNVVSMMFDTLFKLDDNGKIQNSLAKSYVFKVDKETGEHYMEITLNEAYWSNNIRLSADDVVFAWKRLLKSDNKLSTGDVNTQTNGGGTNTYNAAALLYDIKNARAVKKGDASIDDLGVTAEEIDVVRIVFEGEVDKNAFLTNLTSVALAPLYENYVTKNPDWAKKPSTMICSGPFKLGKIYYETIFEKDAEDYLKDDNYFTGKNEDLENILQTKDDYAIDEFGAAANGSFNVKRINYFYLERNVYYDRDPERDPIDESVKPYRILVDCSMSDTDLLKAYKEGKLFYMSDIPMSLRNDETVKKNVEISDALSTFVLAFNEDAMINGEKLFANAEVRKALSAAIDRQAIADAIVYAKAATGLVPTGVFNTTRKNDFREVGGNVITGSAALPSGFDASKYSFSIKVAAYDEVHVAIVEKVAESWRKLGFEVNVERVSPIENNDIFKEVGTEKPPVDICDDLFTESLQRKKYEVIAYDQVAYTADAYSMLAGYAKDFSGMPADMNAADNEVLQPHFTGYNSTDYNNLMEAIYYIPYFASLPSTDEALAKIATADLFPGTFDSVDAYKEIYNAVKAIYDANGITPTTDSKKWADQKATLLHKAEELLMQDMPVIPVVFNQNAVLVSKDLSGIKNTYYTPADFQTTKLKNYIDFYYLNEKGNLISIFEEFPSVNWSKKKK